MAEVHDYLDVETGVLASSLAKRAPGYVSLGFPEPAQASPRLTAPELIVPRATESRSRIELRRRADLNLDFEVELLGKPVTGHRYPHQGVYMWSGVAPTVRRMPMVKLGLNTTDIDTAVEDARAAERAGFDYLGCGEHLFFHGPIPNAFVTLAAAAGATSTIRLVSAITLLPLYPAALAAKLAATLDRVSGGRFELGVGAGGEFPPEFEAVGVDPRTRFRRMDEALEVMQLLFDGGRVSFEGEFTSLHDVALEPAPVQAGGPPIWLGGRKEGAIRRAGRYSDVWMPYMVDPARLGAGLRQVRDAAVGAGRAADAVSGAVFLWTCVDEDGDWARKTGTAVVSATYAQDFAPLADRYLALGTPEQVTARIAEFAAAGASTVLIQPAAEPADRQRVLQAIAEDVLPRVRASVMPLR